MVVRNHFSPAISARNNRSFDWFVIGEKKTGEKPGGEPASAECYCTKLKCDRKRLIIKDILVEATGVELITMLTAHKLLLLGSATTAKKAPLPNPLYVYCTKCFFALESHGHRTATVSHRFVGMDREKAPRSVIRQVTAFPFLRDARRLDYCQFVRGPGAIAITSVGRSGVPVVRRMGLGFSPALRPRLGSNQKISFRANCMLNGSPGPIPGAPL
jgi:hypothetical protein